MKQASFPARVRRQGQSSKVITIPSEISEDVQEGKTYQFTIREIGQQKNGIIPCAEEIVAQEALP